MATPASGRRKVDDASLVGDAMRPAPAGRPSPGGGRSAMADRRATILQVATRRFAEFGFEATTVRQIADDVNILSGSLYHHFATKDEILHEVVRDAVLQMKDNTTRIARAEMDAEHRLIALILLDLGELTRNQDIHAILFNERRLFRKRKEFAYVVQAKRDSYLAWRAVLDDGVGAQLFKPDLDIYLTISTIVRMLNTAADWYKNEEASIAEAMGSYNLDQVIDFHLDFILSAVRTPARASQPIPRKACEDLAVFRA